MAWTFVAETFELLESDGFQRTAAAVNQCSRPFSGVGSSYSVECLFQKAADHVDRDIANRRASPLQLWRIPTVEKLLENIFKFKQVDAHDVPASKLESMAKDLPKDLFAARNKDTSMDLKGMAGVGAATWPTLAMHLLGYGLSLAKSFSWGSYIPWKVRHGHPH